MFPPPLTLVYRIPGEKYGSTLNPGVGSGTLMPTAPMTRVAAGREVAVESERAAPTCKLTATGSREPPINRKSALPPKLVMAFVARSGFQLSTPTLTVSVPSPSAARPPHVLPLP